MRRTILTVALATMVLGTLFAPGVVRHTPAQGAVSPGLRPAASVDDAFGFYRGGGMERVRSYERALGLPADQNAAYFLHYASGTNRGGWPQWRGSINAHLRTYAPASQPRTFILSVPMLVKEKQSPGDPQTLAAGAAGAYDAHWRWLGQQLVAAYGPRLAQDFILRPGWESNAYWYKWGYGTSTNGVDRAKAKQYAAYWRRMHSAVMGPVRAAGLDLNWDMNAAGGVYKSGGFEQAYPGDAYVDVITMDLYQSWEFRSTTDFSAARRALNWLENVATARGKLLGLDEMSVNYRTQGGRSVGASDNRFWFTNIRRWADEMVRERKLHHVIAFESDDSPTNQYSVLFTSGRNWPLARQDLINNFGGPR